jgi:hypothetical protein
VLGPASFGRVCGLHYSRGGAVRGARARGNGPIASSRDDGPSARVTTSQLPS